MAQTLLGQGYSPAFLKVLLGGYISWQSLGYPIATAEAPAGGTPGAIQIQPGGQAVPIVPGATLQIQVGTPAPAGAPAP